MRILYLLLLLSIPGIAAGGENATLNIIPKHHEAGANETFIISINVNPYSNEIYSAQFELLFDHSLIEGIRIENGDFLRQGAAQVINIAKDINNSTGKIEYGEKRVGSGTGAINPGTIAVITFRVKDDAKIGSNQSFILKNVTMTDSSKKELPVESLGGDFMVAGSRGQAQEIPEKKKAISQELTDLMNKSDDAGKISIRISVDEKNAAQNLANLASFLISRGTEVSDMSQLSDSITCKASKRLIAEISSIPFVTQITTYESEDKTKKQPGFEIIITVAVVLLVYHRIKKP